jgi:hypothetical protein
MVMLLSAALVLLVPVFLFQLGVGGGYLFDDYTSVVPLRILRESPEFFFDYVLSDASGPLGRPVSILSFAVEQRFFSAGPAFSQQVSIAVHALNAFLVWLIFLQLLRPSTGASSLLYATLAAAAVFWAVTPQKASTVLYIVQRMTMLAAFFTLVAMNAYLRLRLIPGSRASRLFLWSLVGVCIVVGPFAKETALLTVPMLACLEVFAVARRDSVFDRSMLRVGRALLICGGVVFVAWGYQHYQGVGLSFADRGFTVQERLFSAPRVLADQVQQFLLPNASRMGLIHDDFPLADPTAPAFVDLAATVVLVLAVFYVLLAMQRGVRSVAALGIALFLVGHSLESFFLPLEIYFEHRNYLPSVGLLLVVVALASRAAAASFSSQRAQLVLCGAILAGHVVSSVWLLPNWTSPNRLFVHHLAGHPESSRAHAEYALVQSTAGDLDSARRHWTAAVQLSNREKSARPLGPLDEVLYTAALACIAGQQIEPLLPAPSAAVAPDPLKGAAVRSLQRIYQDGLCESDDWKTLSDWTDDVVSQVYEAGLVLRPAVLRDLAELEFMRGQYLRSYVYAAMSADALPEDPQSALMMVRAALVLGDAASSSVELEKLERLRALDLLSPREELALRSLQLQESRLSLGDEGR